MAEETENPETEVLDFLIPIKMPLGDGRFCKLLVKQGEITISSIKYMNLFRTHNAPKKSVVSKSTEREFEREKKKVEQLEESCKKLQKDTKRWIDSNNVLNQSEQKIVQDLITSPLYQSQPQLRTILDEWIGTTDRVVTARKEMVNNTQKTVCEPIKKLNGVFPCVQAAVRKRDQSLAEYERCQAKLEKHKDKERTGQNIVKVEMSKKALAAAREDFTQQDTALKEDVPKLMEQRIEYIQPCLDAFVKSQVAYNSEAQKNYSSLSNFVATTIKQPLDSKSCSKRIHDNLSQIKALSITADD